MGRLAEYLRSEAASLRAETAVKNPSEAEAWVASVGRLLDTIEGWVADADPERLLRVRRSVRGIREVGLGYYEVPTLEIAVGNRSVAFVPRARNTTDRFRRPPAGPDRPANGITVPSDGLVEFRSGFATYVGLHRVVTPDGDQWFVDSARHLPGVPPAYPVGPFDRDAFERLLVEALE